MRRPFVFWIAVAALALRLIAPLAAYGSAMAGPGFNDVCSADRQAASSSAIPLDEPGSTPARHLLSCCADCPFNGGAAMPPAAFALPTWVGSDVIAAPVPLRAAATAAPGLFPPPRGPPANGSTIGCPAAR